MSLIYFISLYITLIVLCNSTIIDSYNKTIHHRSKRIVNGQRIQISKIPYQVALYFRIYLVCGGSIIAPTWVLTAGHCLYGHEEILSEVKVRAGSERRHIGGEIRRIRWQKLHPQYDPKHLLNDVALLNLDAPFVLNEDITCIRLPPQGHFPMENKMALVSGWGKLDPDAPSTDPDSFPINVRYTLLPVMNFQLCRRYYQKMTLSEIAQFCAGYAQGGKDACTGDSGGPIVINQYQVGIVSWGVSCAKPGNPGVYSNVGTYRDWIYSTMKSKTRPGALTCSRYL